MMALQRGPLVYCIEDADYADSAVLYNTLNPGIGLAATYLPELLNGIVRIEGTGDHSPSGASPFIAIPYYSWAHRGAGQMEVWIKQWN
jgi:hypothetical protein